MPPEPSTAVLILAGLALLAVVASMAMFTLWAVEASIVAIIDIREAWRRLHGR